VKKGLDIADIFRGVEELIDLNKKGDHPSGFKNIVNPTNQIQRFSSVSQTEVLFYGIYNSTFLDIDESQARGPCTRVLLSKVAGLM
jgi:hypothetical protein